MYIENMYFNIDKNYDPNKLKQEILEGYEKYEKVRLIYDLNNKNVDKNAMLKIKKIFDDIGVEKLFETCIYGCKGSIKLSLIKTFLKFIKTKRPVRFLD